jgi:predicted nucleotidyltransferase
MVAVGSKDEVLALLRTLKPDLAEQFRVSQIGIFGSVARDEAHQDSDIDVVVHMQPDMLKRVRLKAELEKALGREVDVVRYRDSMNPYLKARIDREVIYV